MNAMKKIQTMAYVGAIALLGCGLTSCSEADLVEEVTPSPNYNAKTNEVITDFVFNVSMGNHSTTRMSSYFTQADANTSTGVAADENKWFRGIDNAMLLTEINDAGDGKTIATALTMNKDFDLAQVCAAGTLDKDNSRRVLDMSIPISTNTMLFYGKAIKGSVSSADANAGLTQDDVYGKAAAFTIDKDLSEISIKTAPRLYNGASEGFYQAEKLIASILTRIIQAGRIGDDHTAINATDNAGTDNPYGFNVGTNYPEIGWIDYANPNNVSPYDGTALSPSGERLREAYLALTTVEPGEMRAGSGDAVLRQVQDLWSVINGVRCSAPTNEGDAVAKHVAANIHSRISRYFDANVPTDGSAVSNVVWKQKDDLISNLVQNAGQSASDYEALSNTALQMSKFPSYFNLPEGCTQMQYVAPTSATSYDQAMQYRVNLSASDMGGGYITAADYLFPFELTYFGNSPIRTSVQEHKVSDYPNGAHANEGGWDADDSWTSDWVADTHVTSDTRSVAMKNDINYGSALLKTTVHYSAQVLKDNNHAMQYRKDQSVDEPDMEIEVNGTTFQLNGVLVGGQPKELGWDYIYKAGATDNNYNGMVYDHAIPDAAKIVPAYVANVNKDNLACNYTIVADNYVAAANQNKVYVALEFINNSGDDFWGEHNLIRKGGVFYLIGELDPTTATTAPTWPTYHALPPYKADGSSIQTPRVFMQDYMTTAHFSIGVNSLKYAYNTVPDLRSSNASLGLSVDLKWSTGLVFEDVILGGE